MSVIDIRLSADRISARAGETVRIKVSFDKLAFASVNERREKEGYKNVIRTQGKVQGIDILATVHEDTTDFIVMTDSSGVPHLNENQNAVAAWYHVAVVDGPKPVDLGKYLYSVGLLSDLHICKNSNQWWDEDDFKRCMKLFVDDTNIKCIMGCGDVSESSTNAYQKHPEAVCDAVRIYFGHKHMGTVKCRRDSTTVRGNPNQPIKRHQLDCGRFERAMKG